MRERRPVLALLLVASWVTACAWSRPPVEASAPLASQEPPSGPAPSARPRARDLGIAIGTLPPGPRNAITDVEGVRVGHRTRVEGESVRTGVTAVLPHPGNPFREKVPAAIAVGNGFGKLAGSTQVNELGEIESPILLTSTLSVAEALRGGFDWLLALSGNETVRSANVVVGETNDGYLNDIRARVVTPADAVAAIRAASGGAVAEGCVGAGTGTRALGFKAGIGTASRVLPASAGGYTVGVLVQANFGGDLTIAGVPVGLRLARRERSGEDAGGEGREAAAREGGSCMIVLATDAPILSRNLRRLARRTFLGLARAGSHMTNGSGDYAIAFSTALANRVRPGDPVLRRETLANDRMSALFRAAVEATEEAVVNALFAATDTRGHQGREVRAVPIDEVREILRDHGVPVR